METNNPYHRKSYIEIGEIYFWTATINQWQPFLENDAYKKIIVQSIEYLSEKSKMDVFAFIIMPNHIHLILRTIELNGKETAQGSFLKYTAHEFKKKLEKENPELLPKYAVNASNKNYEFWKRDPLAILLFSKEMAYQKLDYLHWNPLAGKWQLVKDPCDYFYSSAKFYEMGVRTFAFLKDLRDEF